MAAEPNADHRTEQRATLARIRVRLTLPVIYYAVRDCLSRAYAAESTDAHTPQNRRFGLNRTPMQRTTKTTRR